MKPSVKIIIVVCLLPIILGCAQTTETAKKVWGSSTAALDQARVNALRKTYVCSFDECFDAVLSMGREEESLEPETEKFFDIFLKNRRKGHMVVIGIKGNVDTTEVGIFFEDMGQDNTRIEVSSLSSSAKRRVARAVFDELNIRFPVL